MINKQATDSSCGGDNDQTGNGLISDLPSIPPPPPLPPLPPSPPPVEKITSGGRTGRGTVGVAKREEKGKAKHTITNGGGRKGER